jgi:hypothetical protein
MENLDSLSSEKLLELYQKIQSHPRIMAKELGLSVRDAKQYKAYAINKYTAMNCRTKGEIQAAMKYEDICDLIYGRMSKNARW